MLIKKALFNEESKKLHNFSGRLQERRGGDFGVSNRRYNNK